MAMASLRSLSSRESARDVREAYEIPVADWFARDSVASESCSSKLINEDF